MKLNTAYKTAVAARLVRDHGITFEVAIGYADSAVDVLNELRQPIGTRRDGDRYDLSLDELHDERVA